MSPCHTPRIQHDIQGLLDLVASNPNLEFIDLNWVDFSGILRTRVLPVTRCLELALRPQPCNVGCFSMIGLALGNALNFPEHIVPGSRDGLYPAWSSCKMLGSKRALVMCCVSEEPVGETSAGKANFERCPRNALENLLIKVESDHSISFMAGIELEFFLVHENNDVQEHNETSYWSMASAIRGSARTCIEDCVKALRSAGIAVEQFHAEYALWQFEISTGPQRVLQAVDSMVQSQEIIKNVSISHRFRACFLPKPFPTLAPSGLHLHLSLKDEAGTGNEPMLTTHFLAGVLDRLSLLCAFAMPTEESYTRVNPEILGEWVAWGSENRMTPVRKISENHLEFRALDFTSNPYLSAAVYLAAGLLGIREKTHLTVQDFRGFLAKIESKEREELGIRERLPTTFEEALKIMKSGWMGLDDMLGAPLLNYYSMVKDGEQASFLQMSKSTRAKIYQDNF